MSRAIRTTALLFAILASPSIALAQQELKKIRLGLVPFSESLGSVIADRQGFFKEEGIEVEISRFDGSALAVPVLQSGRIDVILSNTITTMQVTERGLNVVLLAPGASIRSAPPDTTFAMMARKGELPTPKALEGKRVAVNVINSATWLFAVAWLEKKGVDWTKVRFVEVPIPQMNDPLINEQVDAITQVDPFRTALMATGKAEIMGWPVVEVAPEADITQYVALSSWIEKNRDLAIRFARAVKKGAEFANTNPAAAREINQQYTKLNPAFADKVLLPQFRSNFNVAGMTHVMELMVKFNMLKSPVDVSRLVLATP